MKAETPKPSSRESCRLEGSEIQKNSSDLLSQLTRKPRSPVQDHELSAHKPRESYGLMVLKICTFGDWLVNCDLFQCKNHRQRRWKSAAVAICNA